MRWERGGMTIDDSERFVGTPLLGTLFALWTLLHDMQERKQGRIGNFFDGGKGKGKDQRPHPACILRRENSIF